MFSKPVKWAAMALFGLMAQTAMAGDGPSCRDDAMLVFDASGSMAEMGYNGLDQPRILDARAALRRSLPQITEMRKLGLIIYGPGHADQCSNIDLRLMPQLRSAPRIINEVEQVNPDGNTPLTEAVHMAAEKLKFREKPGVVVLVTDGRETCGGNTCNLAAELGHHAGNIKVHVIGFKLRSRHYQLNRYDTTTFNPRRTVARCLADRTGGKYVSTETVEELVKALQETLGCPLVGWLKNKSSSRTKIRDLAARIEFAARSRLVGRDDEEFRLDKLRSR